MIYVDVPTKVVFVPLEEFSQFVFIEDLARRYHLVDLLACHHSHPSVFVGEGGEWLQNQRVKPRPCELQSKLLKTGHYRGD